MLSSLQSVKHLFQLGSARSTSPTVPAGLRLYAIGDIHGRADLLHRLHLQIEADLFTLAPGDEARIVYLGDYIDRGLDSRAVIELLLGEALPGVPRVFLKGNHEDSLLEFLRDVSTGPNWFAVGGDATAMSYGVRVPSQLSMAERFEHIWQALHDSIPEDHLSFLQRLDLWHEVGDYLCVHAGIRPGIPIEAQQPHDLMWIRRAFLESREDHGKFIVHGHSARREPDIQKNRIGIDTTAFATNVLTCLVLEGTERRFLATGAQNNR